MRSWIHLIEQGLEEDDWELDWTSRGLGAKRIRASVFAKSPGIWAGELVPRACESVARGMGETIRASRVARDGTRLEPGDRVFAWSGPAALLLAFERVALNLAAYASGIATATASVATLASRVGCRICPTRKILPGYRTIAIHAVRAGGGHPHRHSLAGGALVKENHAAAAGGLARAIRLAREEAPHGIRVQAEARNLTEARAAIRAGAEALLLDNFDPAAVRRAVAWAQGRCPIEVSGGIHAGNIGEYLIPGVDVVSLGSLTHSVRSLDLTMLVGK